MDDADLLHALVCIHHLHSTWAMSIINIFRHYHVRKLQAISQLEPCQPKKSLLKGTRASSLLISGTVTGGHVQSQVSVLQRFLRIRKKDSR